MQDKIKERNKRIANIFSLVWGILVVVSYLTYLICSHLAYIKEVKREYRLTHPAPTGYFSHWYKGKEYKIGFYSDMNNDIVWVWSNTYIVRGKKNNRYVVSRKKILQILHTVIDMYELPVSVLEPVLTKEGYSKLSSNSYTIGDFISSYEDPMWIMVYDYETYVQCYPDEDIETVEGFTISCYIFLSPTLSKYYHTTVWEILRWIGFAISDDMLLAGGKYEQVNAYIISKYLSKYISSLKDFKYHGLKYKKVYKEWERKVKYNIK